MKDRNGTENCFNPPGMSETWTVSTLGSVAGVMSYCPVLRKFGREFAMLGKYCEDTL